MNDNIDQALHTVISMRRCIDSYESQLDNIFLNLKHDHFQHAVDSPLHHRGFVKAHKFLAFIHEKHPEILEEWRKEGSV